MHTELVKDREVLFNKEKIRIPAIVDNFILNKHIADGSNSIVFLAANKVEFKKFACKVYPKWITVDKGLPIKDFVDNEIKINEILNGEPSLIVMNHHTEDSKYFYIFMPYFEYGTLQKLIDSHEGIDVNTTKFILYKILCIVKNLHEHKIIHCDIKPDNIYLNYDFMGYMEVYLSDFSCSIIVDDTYSVPCGRGTPYYMSPECISNDPHDGRASDVWSCGVLLYTMLTGNVPFRGVRTMDELIDRISHGKYIIPDYVLPEPANLIKKLMTIDFKKRITIDEAIQDPWFE